MILRMRADLTFIILPGGGLNETACLRDRDRQWIVSDKIRGREGEVIEISGVDRDRIPPGPRALYVRRVRRVLPSLGLRDGFCRMY